MGKESDIIKLLTEISAKLDKLIAFIAIQNKERDEKIKILVSLGFTNSQISELTEIPKGTVDMIRAGNKRRWLNWIKSNLK